MSVRDLVTAGDPSALDEQALVRFLQSRRWFAGGQQLAGTAVLEIIPLVGNPPLAVALIETRYITGIHGVTQLLLGVRPATGDGATIQGEGDIELYEAFTAPADVPQLAARMLALADVEHGGTTLECRSTPDGAAGDMAGSARSLDADQSNSSIVCTSGTSPLIPSCVMQPILPVATMSALASRILSNFRWRNWLDNSGCRML